MTHDQINDDAAARLLRDFPNLPRQPAQGAIDNDCRWLIWWRNHKAQFTTMRQASIAAWREALATPALSDARDAERLTWLEKQVKATSYRVMFAELRDPAVNAGMTRIRLTTGVGSGPWAREYESWSLRTAIDAAMALPEVPTPPQALPVPEPQLAATGSVPPLSTVCPKDSRPTCSRCGGRGYFDEGSECGRCKGSGLDPVGAGAAELPEVICETEEQGFAWEAFHQFCPELVCYDDARLVLTPAQAETVLRRMGWRAPGEIPAAPLGAVAVDAAPESKPVSVHSVESSSGAAAALWRGTVDAEILDDIERALAQAREDHCSPDLDELDCEVLLDMVRQSRGKSA